MKQRRLILKITPQTEAGVMQKAAKNLALHVYSEPLRCEVRGMKGPLVDNELEKAASFTNEFLSTIGKKL